MAVMKTKDFATRLASVAMKTEALFDRMLDESPAEGEIARPLRLIAAMRHAVLGAGIRLHLFLLVEAAALFGVSRNSALLAGAALEIVHCHTLIHDDLPALDDGDLRRGRPTLHKAFDALLAMAFECLARVDVHRDAGVRIALISELAQASGVGGMAGGQMLDLAAEGRFDDKRKLRKHEIETMQAMKTGALIRFACRAGAILGQADADRRAALDRYGMAIG
jgi:farnesyl diphosphate synthase